MKYTNNIRKIEYQGLERKKPTRGLCFAAAVCECVDRIGLPTRQRLVLCSGKVSSLFSAGIELALLVNFKSVIISFRKRKQNKSLM